LGSVLSQKTEKVDQPFSFACRRLTNAEKNYSTSERLGR
jgi:hypothetical protein